VRLTVILLLAAVGFLVAALRTDHAGLAWASVALSVVAAAIILRRWRRSWLQRADSPDDELVLAEDEPVMDLEAAEAPRSLASVTAVQPGQTSDDEIQIGDDQPGEEDTDAADLLLIYELADEVLVVDERPRYHLARCRLADHERAERLPVREARELGFTPCARCRPDTILARKYRAEREATTAAAEPGKTH
jgi:hypothetical protein